MKIVGVSNFDNETVNDVLVAGNISESYQKCIVTFLNTIGGDYSRYWYKAVEDDYTLHRFEP